MQGEMFLPCCATTGKFHLLQLFVRLNISSCSKITSCYSLQKMLDICSEYVLNEIIMHFNAANQLITFSYLYSDAVNCTLSLGGKLVHRYQKQNEYI